VGELALLIGKSGFSCVRCARCCCGESGDNEVALFPGEIREIMSVSERSWLEVALPPDSNDFDLSGARHTFEWVLRRKPDGDCIFLEGGLCTIYEHRPWICRTYPFHLRGVDLLACECDSTHTTGLPSRQAVQMAAALKRRQVYELEETIALLERYVPFEPGCPSDTGRIIVHDSEGMKYVKKSDAGGYDFSRGMW